MMMNNPVHIAVFASGNGSNAENLVQYFAQSSIARVALIVSNKADAFVLERARRLGVPTAVVPKAELQQSDHVLSLLREHQVEFIVLAGFLPLVPDFLVAAYNRRMLNIHPSLLPKFGGKGMWGHHVHEAVKAAGETETGMTVHWVSPVCDGGEIIAQYRVALSPTDGPEDIARKEHELEMLYFPKVVEEAITHLP